MAIIISVLTINLLLNDDTPDSNENKIKKLIQNGLLLSNQTYQIKETNQLIHTNPDNNANTENYSDFEDEVESSKMDESTNSKYSDFTDVSDNDSDF